MKRLTWDRCECCCGQLPAIDGENDAPELPKRLRHGGDCPGDATTDGICGAYGGWSRRRIEAYVARKGVRVEA